MFVAILIPFLTVIVPQKTLGKTLHSAQLAKQDNSRHLADGKFQLTLICFAFSSSKSQYFISKADTHLLPVFLGIQFSTTCIFGHHLPQKTTDGATWVIRFSIICCDLNGQNWLTNKWYCNARTYHQLSTKNDKCINITRLTSAWNSALRSAWSSIACCIPVTTESSNALLCCKINISTFFTIITVHSLVQLR